MRPMKLEGTIVLEDVGPGVFLFEAKDGARYTLASDDAALKRPGISVEIDGELVRGGMGIAVEGDVLRVRKYRVLAE
jgi:hypothetical protein